MNKNKIKASIVELKKNLSENARAREILNELEEISQNLPDSKPLEFTPGEKVDFYLYSDGACRGNPGIGSWASIALNSKGETLFEACSLDDHTTNNKMELTGALKAMELILDYAKDEGIKDFSAALYTDSKYVSEGMNSWRHNWKKRGWKKSDGSALQNLELWKSLDELSQRFSNLKFNWVKGHNNHPQNERCDELCNEVLDRSSY